MTINEIAQMAGVSRATVSRFLNDGYVSEEKRERIAKVIEQTGYVPSQNARTLRTGKTHFVGVVIPKIDSGSVSREVAGITWMLASSGYQTFLANTNNDEKAELTYLRELSVRHGVDGLILIATVVTDEHIKTLSEMPVPTVVLGQRVPGMSCVYFDDYNAIYDLTLCCTEGCVHPAYIGVTQMDEAAGRMRKQAFLDAMSHAGRSEADIVVELGEFNVQSGRVLAEKIMREHPKTDAMVCATDAIAAGAMDYLREQGRVVPSEIRVTGLGDSTLSSIVYPHLTTVHYPYRSSGVEAARMLLEAIEQGESIARETKMGFRLVLRDTTPEIA